MLFSRMGSSSPIRVQGAFVCDEEVMAICHHTITQQEANYDEKYMNVKFNTTSSSSLLKEDEEDEEYEMCLDFCYRSAKSKYIFIAKKI